MLVKQSVLISRRRRKIKKHLLVRGTNKIKSKHNKKRKKNYNNIKTLLKTHWNTRKTDTKYESINKAGKNIRTNQGNYLTFVMQENNVSRSLEVTAEQFIDKHGSIFWVCLITCTASYAMAASSCTKYYIVRCRLEHAFQKENYITSFVWMVK